MSLEKRYQELRREATVLAGEPKDIPQRATMLHEIYLDSRGNHGFAEIATHGALWGFRFFETTGTLGRLISYRYFYNHKEMKYRHGLLQTFADGFKTANRSVFIDTYSNYYFTKELGEEKEAEAILKPELLDALRRIHRAAKAEKLLATAERRNAFSNHAAMGTGNDRRAESEGRNREIRLPDSQTAGLKTVRPLQLFSAL
jgi:hypothetical protein